MMLRREFASHAPAVLALFFFGLMGLATSSSLAATVADQRAEVQKMRGTTLEHLYRLHPAAKEDVQKAAGYAVFSNVGINLILLSAAGGSGVAHDNATGKDTYMKMVSGGFGIGLGVKDFRGVFVFATADKLNRFINSGWEASAQADAAAKAGGQRWRCGGGYYRGTGRKAVPVDREWPGLAGHDSRDQVFQA
jgi:lipid-binding SYLF domain-containing protein